MIWILFLLQSLDLLLQRPITNAIANEVKKDVVVVVSYTNVLPISTCVYVFNLDDREMLNPYDHHCWKPKDLVADIDVWKDQTLNSLGNILVVVKYPDDKVVSLVLRYINS